MTGGRDLDPVFDTDAYRLREVGKLAEEKLQRYAAEVIAGIKKWPPEARQSGDDSVLADVWEEWKYQMQREESSAFEVYEKSIRGLCRGLVQALPRDEQGLLWLYTDAFLESQAGDVPYGDPVEEALEDELYERVCSIAADEPLKRDPDEEDTQEPAIMKHLILTVGREWMHLYVDYQLGVALFMAAEEEGVLLEAIEKPIGRGYTLRKDPPHDAATGQYHVHGRDRKGRELFAMNFDGSAHDGYHQTRIQKIFIEPLKKLGFTIPPDEMIECIDVNPLVDILLEGNDSARNVVEDGLNGFRKFLNRTDIDRDKIIESAIRKHFDE